MDFQISWRNLWRNPRRTVAVLAAVTTGTWALLFMLSFGRGFMVGMIEKAIDTMTGHIQIHADGFLDQPDINHLMEQDWSRIDQVLNDILPESSIWTYRIRMNTVISNARHSGGATMIGANWKTEKAMTFLRNTAVEFEEFDPEDPHGIVIGKALLEKFETEPGNKLILMARDSTGEVASRAFRIRGVFNAELESTEKQFVFVTLEAAREFLGLPNQLSEVSIRLPDEYATDQQVRSFATDLTDSVDDSLEVKDWLQLEPAISAYVEMSDQMNYIVILIVFIAMGFGLVNTMLMAVHERIREFGLVKALGMHNWRIIRMVLTESILLILIGLLLGNIVGLATVWYFATHGIDLSAFAASTEYMEVSRVIYFYLTWEDYIKSNLLVSILGVIVSLYPAFFAARFTPVDAMRHVG